MCENMTREEALLVFNLSDPITEQEIENRYFILTKRARASEDREKSAELAAAYDVLTGRAQQRKEKEILRANAKKYWGKTKDEWKVYFGYTWLRYVLILICVCVVGSIVYGAITRKEEDLKIVAVGHFSADNTILSNYAKEKTGYENPSVSVANAVFTEEIEFSEMTMQGEMVAAAFMATRPEIIITDRVSMPQYLGSLLPMDELYQEILNILPPEMAEKITPVRSNLLAYREMGLMEGEEPEYEPGDDEEYIYGLMITDPELMYGYGFLSLWPPYENPKKEENPEKRDPALIFSVSAFCDNPENGLQFVKDILIDQDYFQEVSKERIAEGL